VFELHGPAPRRGGPLVVVAVREEAQAFAGRLPTLVTGVGKVRAATATTWAVLTHAPGLVLNVGTAGALRPHGVGPDEVAHGVVHEVGTVHQHDLDGAAIAAIVGEDPAPPLHLSDSGIVLVTGDRFIASPTARDRLAQVAHLVDMEGYAVAAAAQRLGVAVRLAKTVSDDAGHEALASWLDALHAASHLLAGWLGEALDEAVTRRGS
jgi:adenosylhomocysteine nucleosidase